jgi:hypothetical protein
VQARPVQHAERALSNPGRDPRPEQRRSEEPPLNLSFPAIDIDAEPGRIATPERGDNEPGYPARQLASRFRVAMARLIFRILRWQPGATAGAKVLGRGDVVAR